MLSRRAALKGGTAVAVSAAVGTAASAVAIPVSANPDANLEDLHAGWHADEPLLEMEKEWFAWRDHCCNYPDRSDAARDPLFEQLNAMEVEMHRTPATTPAGIAVKLRMWARLHGHHFEGDWWERSVEDFGYDLDVVPIIAALHDAERLAGRAQS